LEEKREIVLASLAPGAMSSAICRQHGIGSGQLSVWRGEFRNGKLGHPTPPILNFAQAVVQTALNLSTPEAYLPVSRPDSAPVCGPKRRGRGPLKDSDLIEIALPNGMVVRVGADVDQAVKSRPTVTPFSRPMLTPRVL
jgi:transposase